MLLTTTEYLDGKELKILGMVTGSTVHSKHIGKDFMSGLKTIVGGELKGYTEMMNDARDVAIQRMTEQAKQMGADAVISIRFSSSAIMASAAEIMAYGTAVKFK